MLAQLGEQRLAPSQHQPRTYHQIVSVCYTFLYHRRQIIRGPILRCQIATVVSTKESLVWLHTFQNSWNYSLFIEIPATKVPPAMPRPDLAYSISELMTGNPIETRLFLATS
jgi:hypothetical protein